MVLHGLLRPGLGLGSLGGEGAFLLLTGMRATLAKIGLAAGVSRDGAGAQGRADVAAIEHAAVGVAGEDNIPPPSQSRTFTTPAVACSANSVACFCLGAAALDLPAG